MHMHPHLLAPLCRAGVSLSLLLALALPGTLQHQSWWAHLAAFALEVVLLATPACLVRFGWPMLPERCVCKSVHTPMDAIKLLLLQGGMGSATLYHMCLGQLQMISACLAAPLPLPRRHRWHLPATGRAAPSS